MSKCTAAEAVSASAYWVGYKEKASEAYSKTRDKSAFSANAGSGNYAYPAYLCGCNGQSWCAATVSCFIYEASGSNTSDAKAVLHGVWPYINVVQVYNAAPDSFKGRSKSFGGSWKPAVGDIVIFDWEHDNYRDHTGLCVAVTSSSITVREGNSGNMVKDNTYALSSNVLWGYVRPAYADAVSGGTVAGSKKYGSDVDVKLPELSYGCYGNAVKAVQLIINHYYSNALKIDGEFGTATKGYVVRLQAKLGVTADGVVGAKTWYAMLREME